jgi:hypothetical protein
VQFHGTAGIWRRKTLDRAGGWNCLTETEDIEVSIRALLQGCRVIYLDRLRLPSELPSSMRHYLRQQMRWKRGWTRVARHYSAPIWRSRAPVLQRADLLQRLYNSFGTALALPFTVAALPTFLVAERLDVWLLPFVLYSGLLLTSLANRFFEERLLREDSRRLATGVGPERRSRIAWNRALSLLPTGFILDLGTMWPLTQATFEGFVREPGWEVTPKGGQVSGGAAREAATGPRLPRYAVGTVMVLFVSFALLIVSLRFGHWVAGLFYLLLVIGSGWVGGMLIAEGKGIGVTPPSLAASPSSPPRLTTQPPTTPK